MISYLFFKAIYSFTIYTVIRRSVPVINYTLLLKQCFLKSSLALDLNSFLNALCDRCCLIENNVHY